VEHLREYQDYLLAYRLRATVGGKLRPAARELTLPEYASKRLERQRLARELLGTGDYRERMKRVDMLTDELNFGFWHNPNETIKFIKQMIEQGGCVALESEGAFIDTLLTRRERALTQGKATLIARYYLGLLRASAAYLDAEVFTRLRGEIEPLRDELPFFVSPEELNASPV
jgi:hypothetical protein